MEDSIIDYRDENEKQFTRIQKFVDDYAEIGFRKLIKIYYIKESSLHRKQMQEWVMQEDLRIREKIADDRITYNLLDIIYKESVEYQRDSFSTENTDVDTNNIVGQLQPNYLWETYFFEELSAKHKDAMSKYLQIDVNSLYLRVYGKDYTTCDDALPFFSQIVDFDSTIRYYAFIKKVLINLEYQKKEEIKEQLKKEKTVTRSVIENPFKNHFTNTQITILVTCVNEVRMFTKQVTDTIMQDFFSGNLKGVLLRSTNTKLIAYFFLQLNTNNYITNNWQSVIDKNNLILATDKGKRPKIITTT